MYIEFNSNPVARTIGDCAVRAIAKALDTSWEFAYIMLALNGLKMGNLMNGNDVISATLRESGFRKANIPNTCPDCMTIRDFAELNQTGTYVVGTGTHVVCIDAGDYYDIFDSGDEPIIYVWYDNVNPRFE